MCDPRTAGARCGCLHFPGGSVVSPRLSGDDSQMMAGGHTVSRHGVVRRGGHHGVCVPG